MASNNKQSDKLFLVGVDGGGTRCRASIYDHNHTLLGCGYGGPANPVNGFEQAKESIIDAIEEAKYDAGLECPLSRLWVGAGLAGLHLPIMQVKMNDWQHPFAALHTISDLHAAVLGAHQGESGAVIIIGTGFSALGVVNDTQIAIGGYGFPINATCSGSWFGLELVKAVLLDSDGVGPTTSMTQAVLVNEDIVSLATRTNNGAPDVFGRLAPIVFEQAGKGDEVALGLIKQGSEFINRVINILLDNQVTQITLMGGVSPFIVNRLNPDFKQYLCSPKELPEFGAMMYAKKKLIPIPLNN